jgi:riboflavin kinase/FMN adenylyltransferase
MKIITTENQVPDIEKSVITVGNFDGIHKGHYYLIEKLRERAQHHNADSIIVTFEPHTRAFFNPTRKIARLSTFDEKALLLREFAIDYLVCLRFDKELATMTPEDFVKKILIQRFKAVEWVMGKNHTFGKNRKGDYNFLREYDGKNHFNMISVDLYTDSSFIVSSTEIRNLLDEGRMVETMKMLGHPFLVRAERIHGMKKGSELGYPTLNFRCPPSHKVIPPPGVYAAEVEYGDTRLCGALYFGNCPTFGDRDYHFEFNSLDTISIDPELHKNVAIWIHKFIRYDKTFSSQDDLVKQIKNDIFSIKQFFHKE